MKGSLFAKTLPKKATPKREQMILDAVRRRDIAPIAWVPIQTSYKNKQGHTYTATIFVSRDALRVGDATDSFRATVNHRTAQLIADELGVVLPTPKLSDEIFRQAPIQLDAMKQAHLSWVNDGTMSLTRRMLEQSAQVDKAISDQHATGKKGLVADVGKDWVNTKRLFEPYQASSQCEPGPERAANYGWHLTTPWIFRSESLPEVNVFQPVGLCHTIGHVDYSQVVRLVRRDVDLCGPGMGPSGCGKIDIRAIVTDPALAGLVSHTGVLPSMRHPDVPPPCDKRCPEPVSGFGQPQPGGSISCPLDCEPLPPPQADPTIGMSAMSVTEKLVMLASGATLGYFAVQYLLPKL